MQFSSKGNSMGIERVEIGNAIIGGIAEGGGCLEQMSAIVEHLNLAGFVIVPKEPTEAMIEKGMWSRSESGRYGPREIATTIYGAMVAAAVTE